jgi:hypothetical protein
MAAHNRYELTKVLLKYRIEGKSMALFEHRFMQHRMWKEEALRAMKNLDKIVKGIKLLDDVLETIFRGERKFFEKHLDRRKLREIA